MTPCSGGCYTGDSGLTNRLYPEVKFTCNGMVMKWRAAARPLGGSRNTILWIWREISSGSQIYRKISSVELGVCGSGVDASPVVGMEGVYECTLPESSRVTVQPGDIIGTEVAASSEVGFGLLYDNSRGYGPLGYIFDGPIDTTPTLSQKYNNNRPNEIPLISLTVEPIMATTTTTSEPGPQTQTEEATTESRETTEIYTSSDTTTIDTTSPQTTTPPNSSFVEDSFPDKELIIGALVAGLAMVALLIVIAFVLAYLSRRVGVRDGEERSGGRSQRKSSDLKKDLQDMEYNAAYIPRISVKDNVAYGQSVHPYTVVYDTILDAEEPSSMNTMTREVSVSNVYSSVP